MNNTEPKEEQISSLKELPKSSLMHAGIGGITASISQSAIIKLGTASEKSVYDALMKADFESINEIFSKAPTIIKPEEERQNEKELSELQQKQKKKEAKQIQQNQNLSYFFSNFDKTKKYVGQKISLTYEGKSIQADLLVYVNGVFWILEIKSSSVFDTKKALAEQNSLFNTTIALQKLLNTQTIPDLKDCLVQGTMCCLNAKNKNEIFTGFKGNIKDHTLMWTDTSFARSMISKLEIIYKADNSYLNGSSTNHASIFELLKLFTSSENTKHDIFNDEVIKSYSIQALTGEEFCTIFNISLNELLIAFKAKFQEFLAASFEEKKPYLTAAQIKHIADNFARDKKFDEEHSKPNTNTEVKAEFDLLIETAANVQDMN